MIYVQLSLLAGLSMLSLSGQGMLQIIVVAVPFLVTAGLLLITAMLFRSIMRMLIDPELLPSRDNHMHGSALPVLVFVPNN